jgi:virginiamycin B lyase
MRTARYRHFLLAISLILTGCAGHTATIAPLSTSRSADLKPMAVLADDANFLLEFPVATNGNFIRPIALGSDGNIWFGAISASGSPELGRIGLTGKAAYFPTENGVGVIIAISDGPEGDVWFTSLGGHANTWKIGKMTTQGIVVFNEALPNGFGANTHDLAVGSDGDVWFPVAGGTGNPSIAKSTKAGAITIFGCSFCLYSPSGAARGADGKIWFTYSYGSAFGVAEVASNGSMTDYPAPLNEVVEANPVLGHDGRIWFSVQLSTPQSTTYQIGAIDTNGTMAFYALPDQRNLGVNGLTLGPDNRVWFSQSTSIGSVGTRGGFSNVLTVPTTTPYNKVESLATDAGGDVWFDQLSSSALFALTHS